MSHRTTSLYVSEHGGDGGADCVASASGIRITSVRRDDAIILAASPYGQANIQGSTVVAKVVTAPAISVHAGTGTDCARRAPPPAPRRR